MNIANSFIQYLVSAGYGTFGTDLFVGGAPQEAPDEIMWVVAGGGQPIQRADSGEVIKQYILNVFFRSTDQEVVYDTLQELEVELNAGNCTQLANFDTIDMEATQFPADQDLDNEDRSVGLLQVTITTYYKE